MCKESGLEVALIRALLLWFENTGVWKCTGFMLSYFWTQEEGLDLLFVSISLICSLGLLIYGVLLQCISLRIYFISSTQLHTICSQNTQWPNKGTSMACSHRRGVWAEHRYSPGLPSQAGCFQVMKCNAVKYHDRKHKYIKHEGAS